MDKLLERGINSFVKLMQRQNTHWNLIDSKIVEEELPVKAIREKKEEKKIKKQYA